MPPINQGSRTALITWTAVTSFLFVLSLIFAIYYYVESSRLAEQNDTLTKRYSDVLPAGALQGGTEVTTLDAVRKRPENQYNASQGLLDVSMQRTDRLAKLLAGPSAQSGESAGEDAKRSLEGAAAKTKAVGVNLAANDMVGAVKSLADAVVQRSTEAANERKRAEDAVAQLQAEQNNKVAQIKQLTDAMEQLRGELEAANANVTSMTQTKDEQLTNNAASSDERLRELQASLDKANAQISELNRQLTQKQTEVTNIQQRLADIRPNVSRPVTSQADGYVVRLPGAGVAYIDLGRGDQLIPGMTFEVYDRTEGIPPLGDPNNDIALPRGKGSLEVTRVGATSSECRIVNVTQGAVMMEGDIIANLIYDKNTKSQFLIHGNFDLDRTGRANPQDAEVLKKLVNQWGGQVVEAVNENTDFVVLGKEPVVPALTQDVKDDPVLRAQYDKAVADFDAYVAISNRAREYRIPILNQNRFLYTIGFFELAKR